MKQLTPEQIKDNWDKLRELITTTFEGDRLEKLNKMYDYFEERMCMAPASGKEHFHNAHVGGYAERIKSKKLIDKISGERDDFLQTLFKPFSGDLQKSFYEKLDNAMHPHKEELRITTGLKDDIFNFRLTMPGLVTRSNADTLEGDTLKWEFKLGDFAGDDYVMEAVSVIYKTKAIQRIAVFVIIASILLWLFLWITVFRKP